MASAAPNAATNIGAVNPGRPVCRFCGAPLDPHQAAKGAICAAPRCQMQRVQQASRAVFQRDWDSYIGNQRKAVEVSGPLIAQAARELNADPTRLAIGVVPHQDRALVPLPDDRRAEFTARLDEIIATAFAEPAPELDLTRREREEAGEHPLIDATCSACQGKCCSLGGPQMAFLKPSDIQRYRQRHPGCGAGEARAYYLNHIPERSVEYACVFQSAKGCTLDRSDRADICNRYHCNPQTQLLKRLRDMSADKAVIIANEGDAGPVVAAFDLQGGHWRIKEGAGLDDELIAARDGPDKSEAMAALDAALAQLPPPLPQSSSPPGGARRPVPPGCEFCGAPLDPHQAVTTRCCGAANCESRRIEVSSRIVAERKRARYIARREKAVAAAEADLARAAAVLGTERGELLVGVVPFQNKPVEPLPAERRAAFEAHLDRIVAAGFAGPVVAADLEGRANNEADEEPLMSACCATCQGSCCALGGPEMAFLTETDVHLHRQRNPGATPAEVRAFYLGRLPERSVVDACVFQSARGCVLPRDRRADICNSFHCKGQAMLAESWRRDGARQAAIVGHADTVPRAVAVFREPGGWAPVVRPGKPDDPQ